MPLPHKSVTDRRQSAGKVLNELGLRDHGSAPSTKVVSDKGSSLDQIADKHVSGPSQPHPHLRIPMLQCTAHLHTLHQQAMLNDTSHVSDEATEFEYTWQKKEPNPLVTPLFAHECFGAYEFIADDRMDHEDVPELVHRRQSKKSPKDYTVDQIDLNDPNIEMFPSDKSSVLNSLHKIQSSLSAKRSSVDDAPVLSSIEFRRSSVDSGDDSAASTGSMSPTTPTSHKTRENRHSYSGFKKTKSAVSLTSIAEEPKVGDRASPTLSSSSLLKPGESHSPLSSRSPSSEGEDVLVMNGYQEKHKNIRTGRANLSCDPMDERRLDTLQVLQPSHEIA